VKKHVALCDQCLHHHLLSTTKESAQEKGREGCVWGGGYIGSKEMGVEDRRMSFLVTCQLWQAIAALNKALAASPGNPEVLLSLGVSYTNELDQRRAIAYLMQWLQQQPGQAGAASVQLPANARETLRVAVDIFRTAAQMVRSFLSPSWAPSWHRVCAFPDQKLGRLQIERSRIDTPVCPVPVDNGIRTCCSMSFPDP